MAVNNMLKSNILLFINVVSIEMGERRKHEKIYK